MMQLQQILILQRITKLVYQSAQEILYQEYLAKTLTEKHDSVSSQMDQIIHDANNEISKLRKRLSAISIDNDGLRAAHNDLKNAYKDKTKAHTRAQKQYDSLKKQSLQLDVQYAAANAAEETLNSTGQRTMDPRHPELHRHHLSPHQSFQSQRPTQYRTVSPGSGLGDDRSRVQPNFGHIWSSQEDEAHPGTPSQHRTRLPVPSPQTSRNANVHRSHDLRGHGIAAQPLQPLHPASHNNIGNNRYGMSSGIKVGRYHSGRSG
ncbi:MAG: hypothetical protein M1828_004646 [Chrysothrix sp. TS-e1954]|nr:MAG: hypothetical protein M1828_004646 [Chrysothrix sp. TS-e1954]